MIKILEHPLVQNDLRILRDSNTNTEQFRNASHRIGLHLAIESTKELLCEEITVQTPLESTNAIKIKGKLIIIPIIRAGIGLLSAFQEIYPNAIFGYVGMRRNEKTFLAEEYYYSIPQIEPDDKIIILEMMIATGISTCTALNKLQLDGISNVTIVSIISAPEGIEKIRTEFPDTKIITAVLDRELNENKYILPGLGDAGDRFSG